MSIDAWRQTAKLSVHFDEFFFPLTLLTNTFALNTRPTIQSNSFSGFFRLCVISLYPKLCTEHLLYAGPKPSRHATQ
jgi:hypothetical protein